MESSMKNRICVAIFTAATLAWPAAWSQAAVTSINAIQVAKPAGILPGFTTTDILLDFTGNLRGQQLILELTQGSIYHTPFGTNTAPVSAFFPLFPEVEYDTFVTIGGRSSSTSQPVLVIGGAVDLQPGSGQKFDTEGLNIAWAPGAGVDIPSGNDFITARITLSNDAIGTLNYFGSTGAGSGAPLTKTFTILCGAFGGFHSSCGGPVAVQDKTVEYTAMPPSTLVSEYLDFTGFPFGATWALESFESPNGKPATVNADTGLFTWDGFGSPAGVYNAVIRFNEDTGATDTGTLSIVWHIPEPAAATLFAVAGVVMLGLRTRWS
jgi:hypothetical protein